MSAKDVFEKRSKKILKQNSADTVGNQVESHRHVSEKIKDRGRYVPQIDFSDPANFAKFGSAEKYYVDAIERIHKTYPYDGSLYEKTGWLNSSSYFDLYIFENKYPRTNGYAAFTPAAAGYSISSFKKVYRHNISSSYAVPAATDYILIKGGPNKNFDDSNTKAAFPGLHSTVHTSGSRGANVFDLSKNRESNLKIGGLDGNTIEFWLKKDAWTYNGIAATAQNEVIFDLHNISSVTASHANARFRIELDGSPSVNSPIKVTYMSGTNGCFYVPIGHGSGSISGSSYVTKATVGDGEWHHYAITIENTGSTLYPPFKTASSYAHRSSNGTPVEDQKNLKALKISLYVDGQHNNTVVTGSSVDYVSASLHATIASLVDAPSSSADTYNGTAMRGAGRLSASMDEFRFWKRSRNAGDIGANWRSHVGGGTNIDDANTDLGVYYKFNEGITQTASVDSTVLDYSGRISNGYWSGYSSNSRATGSAMVLSGKAEREFKDPIVYSTHPDVSALKSTKSLSGSVHDFENSGYLFKSFPEWIQSQDAAESGELKNLTQIIASYFDTLSMQINQLPKIKNITYPSASYKPHPFAEHMLDSAGFDTSELFADATVVEKFFSRDDHVVYEDDLHDIKNRIYQNIYNNLSYIQKSKGTEKSFRNLIRCFGIDDEILKLNMYANNSTYELNNNFYYTTEKTKCADFHHSASHQAVVYQMTGSAASEKARSYISGTINALDTANRDTQAGMGMTYECEVVFPKTFSVSSDLYNPYVETTSSLFGMHQPKISDDGISTLEQQHQTTFAATDSANFQVFVARNQVNSANARFILTSSAGTLQSLVNTAGNAHGLTSSLFNDVYEDRKWNFAVRIRPRTSGSAALDEQAWGNVVSGAFNQFISATNSKAYQLDFYGVQMIGNTKVDSFHVSASLSKNDGDKFLMSPKRMFVGAHRTNFTGTVLQKSDVKVSSLRTWLDHLSNKEIDAHAMDAGNYGRIHPYENAYMFENSGSRPIPQVATRALNWDFKNVTGSDSAGSFYVSDISSWIGTSTKATATITFSDTDGGSIGYNQTITIVSTDGTSRTYTTKASNNYASNEFDADGGFDDKASALKGAIEHAAGHAGKITVSRADNVLTLTQAIAGTSGNTAITENVTDCTVVSFAGGEDNTDPTSLDIGDHGWLSNIVNTHHPGLGYDFPASTKKAVDTVYLHSAKQQQPEVANSSEMIKILSEDEKRFVATSRPSKFYYAVEKSPYQSVSSEMMKMFATIKDFNNLIGEPVNKYRQTYKRMNKLRSMFFKKVKNNPDVERYIEYYRWIDSAMSDMILQLFPASAAHSKKVRTVIESHVLERNKYQHKYPHVGDRFGADEKNIIQAPILNQYNNLSAKLDDMLLGESTTVPIAPEPQSPHPQDKNAAFWMNYDDDFELLSAEINSARKSISRAIQKNLGIEHNFNARISKAVQKGSIISIESGNNPDKKKVLKLHTGGEESATGQNQVQLVAATGLDQLASQNLTEGTPLTKIRISPDIIAKTAVKKGDEDSSDAWLNAIGSIYKDFNSDLKFTNIHHDDVTGDHRLGTSMQSPFTAKHVGGQAHRNVPINTGSAAGALHGIYSRPEAFRISAPASDLDKNNWTGATATITFSDSDGGGSIDYNQTITIISTDGTSRTYTTKASSNYASNQFDADGGFDDKAEALKGAIEHAAGHAGKITVSRTDNVLTLTQASGGSAGNTTITENITDCTVVSFRGGLGENINIYTPDRRLNGGKSMHLRRSTFNRGPRSVVSIKNILTVTGSEVHRTRGQINRNASNMGNFDKNYQVLQTSGRTAQGRWYAENIDSSNDALKQGTEVAVVRNSVDNRTADFQLLDRTVRESVFVERFSAPGGYEVMSRGYLDRRGEEVSAYNSLNYRNLFIRNSSGSMTNSDIGAAAATAVDCIDTTGYTAGNANASFTIAIPTTAGGLGGTAVTFLLDEDKDDVTTATAAANTITIGTKDASETDAQATSFLINAINGVTAGRFIYASSGNGRAGHDLGVTAKQGSSDTQITLTVDTIGSVGNIASAISSVSGVDIIDVTDFTGGKDGFSNRTRFSGTISIEGGTKHDGLYSMLYRHAGAYGQDSVYGDVPDDGRRIGLIGTPATASFHKTNRNRLRLIKFKDTGSYGADLGRPTNKFITASVHDNYFVQHAIPRSELQYAWITASALTYDAHLGDGRPMANDEFGHTGVTQGYDGLVSTPDGHIPAINFMSASTLGSFWNGTRRQAGKGLDFTPTTQFIQNDFIGLNTNINEPLSASAATVNLSASSNTLGYPNQVHHSITYSNFNYAGGLLTTGDVIFNSAVTLPGLIHHRQGPYGWPTWKQIRTGNHPIARFLRKNNQLSIATKIKTGKHSDKDQGNSGTTSRTISNYRNPFNPLNTSPSYARGTRFSTAQPGHPLEIGLSGKALEEQLEREYAKDLYVVEIKNYKFSPLTTKYKPLLQTVTDPMGNNITLKHAYSNNIEFMPSDELDLLLNTKENVPKQFHDKMVKQIVDDKSLTFNKLVYKETIFPKEQNQFFATTRGRTDYNNLTTDQLRHTRRGQQRVFWRDSINDRLLNKLSASRYDPLNLTSGSGEASLNSYGYKQYHNIGTSSDYEPAGQHNPLGATFSSYWYQVVPSNSIWPLDGYEVSGSEDIVRREGRAPKGISSSGSIAVGELLNPTPYTSMMASINGQIPLPRFLGGITTSGKGAVTVSSSLAGQAVNIPVWFAPCTASQMFVFPQSTFKWGAPTAAADYTREGFKKFKWAASNSGYLAHYSYTHNFWKTGMLSGKRPWYDTYADYANDIRYMAKDHSVIPEFRISEHMDHYISNEFSFNNRFLTLEGAAITSASADTPTGNYKNDFFKVYSHSDFMKHFKKIKSDYADVAEPTAITLRCSGIKKLLPYQGFYPVLRCMQLGTLFSSSYAPFISGSNTSHVTQSATFKAYTNPVASDAAIRTMALTQPFFAPGIMYNTIKAGIAVDYPVVTGSTSPVAAYSSSPTFFTTHLSGGTKTSSKDNLGIFNYRFPFESIIEPHTYMPISSSKTERDSTSGTPDLGVNRVSFINMHSASGEEFNLYYDWLGQYNNDYSMAANNFFGEIPNFFLKQGKLRSFTSAPENQFKPMKSGSTYYMDVDIYMTPDMVQSEGPSNIRLPEKSDSLPYYSASAGYNRLEKYDALHVDYRGGLYGPPCQWSLTSSTLDAGSNTNEIAEYDRQAADPAFAPFTPPYFYGRSTARVSFSPHKAIELLAGESHVFTVDEILAQARVETIYTGSSPTLNQAVSNKLPAGLSQMRISSSVDLFGKQRGRRIEYDITSLKNKENFSPSTARDTDDSGLDRWVISTKFECPILNFSGNMRNLVSTSAAKRRLTLADSFVDTTSLVPAGSSLLGSLSGLNTHTFPKVHEYDKALHNTGNICMVMSQSVPSRGMWSGYGNSPSGSTGIFFRIRESFPEQTYNPATSTSTGSLIDTCGFSSGGERLGELAQDGEKVIHEAVVAIPFIQVNNKRKFFSIPREQVDLLLGKIDTLPNGIPTPGSSVRQMVDKLQKYVIPPHLDFITNPNRKPFAVYVFEFSHALKRDELKDIWQNVMPECATKAEKQDAEFSHPLGTGEFFGGNDIPATTQWMVFKIKQRAEKSYYNTTANSTDDSRFGFKFQAGGESKVPNYSYNWPYDFFSLVELAKIDAEVEFDAHGRISRGSGMKTTGEDEAAVMALESQRKANKAGGRAETPTPVPQRGTARQRAAATRETPSRSAQTAQRSPSAQETETTRTTQPARPATTPTRTTPTPTTPTRTPTPAAPTSTPSGRNTNPRGGGQGNNRY